MYDKEKRKVVLSMKIKEVEKLVGIKADTLYFYEKEGILNPRRNRQNNYREYSQEDIERIKKVKTLRVLGIALSDIKDVLEERVELKAILEKRIDEVEEEERYLSEVQKNCKELIRKNITIHEINDIDLNMDNDFFNFRISEILELDKPENKVGVVLSILIVILSFFPLIYMGSEKYNAFKLIKFANEYEEMVKLTYNVLMIEAGIILLPSLLYMGSLFFYITDNYWEDYFSVTSYIGILSIFPIIFLPVLVEIISPQLTVGEPCVMTFVAGIRWILMLLEYVNRRVRWDFCPQIK